MNNCITVADTLQCEVFSWIPEFVYFKILWKIPNFLKLIEGVKTPKYIGSSRAVPIISRKFSAQFRLHQQDNILSFELLNDFENIDAFNAYRLTVLNEDNEETFEECSEQIGNARRGWIYARQLNHLLLNETDLQRKSLNIAIQGIAWMEKEKRKMENVAELLRQKVAIAPSLFDVQEYSDIIISVEEKQFHVRKSILSSASSVFQELFEAEPNNIIVLSNISSGAFREVLKFIYKGLIDTFPDEVFLDLFRASHKFKLKLLQYICERKVANELKVSNAIGILKLSNEFGYEEMEDYAMTFILKNRNEIVRDKSWTDFSTTNPNQLLTKLCTTLMTKINL